MKLINIIITLYTLLFYSESIANVSGQLNLEAFGGILIFPSGLHLSKLDSEAVRLSNFKLHGNLAEMDEGLISILISEFDDDVLRIKEVAELNLQCFGFRQSVLIADSGWVVYFYDNHTAVSIVTNEPKYILSSLEYFITENNNNGSSGCIDPLVYLVNKV